MSQFDVIGFGALNMDKLFRVDRIVSAEGESFVTDFKEACGGSAANTAVGLARLGCKVGFIGRVADDREGRMLLADLHREKVNTTGIRVVKERRSGTVMGFVDGRGERALYIDPGVNDQVRFADMSIKYVLKARFLHLTSFVGEKPFQAQKKLVESLTAGIKLSFDPGELYARRGRALDPMVRKMYVIMPNWRELELLTGKSSYREGADSLIRKGVETVAVKLGSKGCYVTNREESCSVESFKVKVVDTTGAGDAFCTGFLYGLISSRSLLECGRIGNFVASKCVMKMGAREGLPRLKELERGGIL